MLRGAPAGIFRVSGEKVGVIVGVSVGVGVRVMVGVGVEVGIVVEVGVTVGVLVAAATVRAAEVAACSSGEGPQADNKIQNSNKANPRLNLFDKNTMSFLLSAKWY